MIFIQTTTKSYNKIYYIETNMHVVIRAYLYELVSYFPIFSCRILGIYTFCSFSDKLNLINTVVIHLQNNYNFAA